MKKVVTVDYLNVSAQNLGDPMGVLDSFLTFLQVDARDLKQGRGRYGYPSSFLGEGVLVGYSDTSFLVSLSGFGCQTYNVTSRLVDILEQIQEFDGKVTRLDIAMDVVGNDVFTMEDVNDALEAGDFVSRKKRIEYYKSKKGKGGLLGSTIYIGNPRMDAGSSGNVYLRLYRKDLELKSKGQPLPDWAEGGDIERFEVSINGKKKTADVVKAILEGVDLKDLHSNLLLSLIRFKKPGRASQKSRWQDDQRWLEFLEDNKVFDFKNEKEKKLAKTLEWLKTSVFPTLAVVVAGAREKGIEIDLNQFFESEIGGVNQNQALTLSLIQEMEVEDLKKELKSQLKGDF